MSTTAIAPFEAALIQNDLSKLNETQRLSYYKQVCESVGLNPLTQPFAYITLNGKLTLYAKRDATDQLRKIHRVSITIAQREVLGDVYVVTAQARDGSGRVDESTGAVAIAGLKGDQLANAYLKAETKAKRRVTLSICGLGLLDESEVSSIPEAKTVPLEEPKAIPAAPIHVDELRNVAYGKSVVQQIKDETNAPLVPDTKEPQAFPQEAEELKDILENYTIDFGSWVNRPILALPIEQVESRAKFLRKDGEPKGKAKKFCEMADLYSRFWELSQPPKFDPNEEVPF